MILTITGISLCMIAFNVKMDADGLAATLVKKKGNITYRKKLI